MAGEVALVTGSGSGIGLTESAALTYAAQGVRVDAGAYYPVDGGWLAG